jgi:hypothetical protein
MTWRKSSFKAFSSSGLMPLAFLLIAWLYARSW